MWSLLSVYYQLWGGKSHLSPAQHWFSAALSCEVSQHISRPPRREYLHLAMSVLDGELILTAYNIIPAHFRLISLPKLMSKSKLEMSSVGSIPEMTEPPFSNTKKTIPTCFTLGETMILMRAAIS